MLSYGKPFNTDYRLRYARCVLDLDSMNKEMAMYVEGIQTYCLEVIPLIVILILFFIECTHSLIKLIQPLTANRS